MTSKFLFLAGTFLASAFLVHGGNALWKMPTCAWQRPMGDRPVFEKLQIYDSPGIMPESMTKKGMPIGGIGAGGIMYNLAGSFGPFHMKPGIYEERFLNQGAFHIREQVGDDVKAYTLATEDVMPEWNKLKSGDATYSALFPKASFDYNVFQNNVSLLYFSPIIAHNYKETSYPVGVFLFKIKNTQKKKTKMSFMFTFPNAPYLHRTDTARIMYPSREGLYNKVMKDGKTTAIVLGASSGQNRPETNNTSWCIATSGNTSYVDVWDGASGKAIWDDFAGDGKLSNKALCASSELPSGAVCVSVDLGPGEEKVVPFVLSWYFPTVQFANGPLWKRRFTEYFPIAQTGTESFDVAKEALINYDKWLGEVNNWVDPIVNNTNCPDWLKAGGLNELYYNTFGGSFWENGTIGEEKPFGNRPGQHISAVMECTCYPYLETFDVRQHAVRVTRDLWPENERDILLTYSDIIASTTQGSCTHDLGSPGRNPIIQPDGYVYDYRYGTRRETTPWSEFSPKFIQFSYMYWKQYGDDAYLKEVWNSIIRSFNYQVSTDKNNDGITEMTSSEYVQNKLLNAVLWISSLEALKEMAEYMKDDALIYNATHQLNLARKNSEKQFWNEDLGYYQYNEEIPFLMADAFVGQRCADIFNLPAVLDEERVYSHFKKCFEKLVKPLPDYDGDGVGDVGAANILNLEGGPGLKTSEHKHEYEVWTGVTYNLAASMYHWGRKFNDAELMKNALLTGKGCYYQCWENDKNGFWFATPEALWFNELPKSRGHMYQRVRGIWELLSEVMNK